MAFVSSSVDLWNPYKVLDVYPNSARSSCVGVRNGTEVRCGWTLVPNEHFTASQLAVAAEQLRSMAARHPSHVTPADIRALVQNTLCRHHQWQTSTVEGKWKAEIGNFVHEQGGMPETRRAVKHSQREVAEETDRFDLNEVRKACVALEASQVRCSEMMGKIDRLEKDQAASSGDLALLTPQMAKLQTDAVNRDELDTKVEQLKTQMEARHADLEKNALKATQRLRNDNLALTNLNSKVGDRAQALDERAQRSEQEVHDLRRQLEARGREIDLLQQAKASLEHRADASEDKAESLRQGLQRSNARHAQCTAKRDDSARRLNASLQDLDRKYMESKEQHAAHISRLQQELDQKYTASHDEHLAHIARVQQEQDRKIERLVAQTDARHEELKARSDDSSNRLHASLLQTLDQKYTASQDENAAHISRVQQELDQKYTASHDEHAAQLARLQAEQDLKIERLVKQTA